MNKEIKVLHVIYGFGMGGAETWLLEMMKFLKDNDDYKHLKMEFLCTSGVKGFLDAEIIKYRGSIHYISLNKKNAFSFISGFRGLLKREKYTIIHDHQDFLSGWHFLFGFGLLPKIRIAHVHNPSTHIRDNYGVSRMRRLNQKIGRSLVNVFSTYVGGTSLQVLNEYGFDTKKPKNIAIHCAFDLKNYRNKSDDFRDRLFEDLNIPADHKIILFVGRLDQSISESHSRIHKNSIRAIKIFNKMTNKKTTLLMAGNSSGIKAEYKLYIKNLGLESRVKLLGIRTDVPEIMNVSELLLFPSRAEGLGMVAVEAQAANLFVAASTAVPKECLVIDELVEFIDLKQTDEIWANHIETAIAKEKVFIPLDDERWLKTDFNIINSIKFINSLINNNANN